MTKYYITSPIAFVNLRTVDRTWAETLPFVKDMVGYQFYPFKV